MTKTKSNKQIGSLKRCDKCKSPFEEHHHIHITRQGAYHTSCYKNKLKDKYDNRKENFK